MLGLVRLSPHADLDLRVTGAAKNGVHFWQVIDLADLHRDAVRQGQRRTDRFGSIMAFSRSLCRCGRHSPKLYVQK